MIYGSNIFLLGQIFLINMRSHNLRHNLRMRRFQENLPKITIYEVRSNIISSLLVYY